MDAKKRDNRIRCRTQAEWGKGVDACDVIEGPERFGESLGERQLES